MTFITVWRPEDDISKSARFGDDDVSRRLCASHRGRVSVLDLLESRSSTSTDTNDIPRRTSAP